MGVFVHEDIAVALEIVEYCPGGGVEALDEPAAVRPEVFDTRGAADHVDFHLDVGHYCDENILDGMVAVEELEEVVRRVMRRGLRVEGLDVWEVLGRDEVGRGSEDGAGYVGGVGVEEGQGSS